jgi:hypothetical protein
MRCPTYNVDGGDAMTYRDDLEAATARAEAAERENEALRKRLTDMVERQPRLPLPERFVVAEVGGTLTVRWRWFETVHISILVFAVAWDAFLANWYFGLHVKDDVMHYLFPIAHVAFGIAISYFAITGLVNRTVITASRDRLIVAHGPLPWPGSGTYARADLDQLYVEPKVSSGRRGTTETYVLCAIDRTGRKRTLVKGLKDVGAARWLELELEPRLGIADGPAVTGSVS